MKSAIETDDPVLNEAHYFGLSVYLISRDYVSTRVISCAKLLLNLIHGKVHKWFSANDDLTTMYVD